MEEPPAVLLTDHVTAVFCVPVTVAWKDKESPARTLAVEGETETVIDEVGGGVGEGVFVLELETVPAQPARQPARKTRRILRKVVLRRAHT